MYQSRKACLVSVLVLTTEHYVTLYISNLNCILQQCTCTSLLKELYSNSPTCTYFTNPRSIFLVKVNALSMLAMLLPMNHTFNQLIKRLFMQFKVTSDELKGKLRAMNKKLKHLYLKNNSSTFSLLKYFIMLSTLGKTLKCLR